MRRWVVSLSILMLAVAIAIINPAVRTTINTARSQFLGTKFATRFSGAVGSKVFQPSIRKSSLSTSATVTTMASTTSENDKCSSDQTTPTAIAEKLADKSNAEPELPKLSAADFRTYNRLAVMMDAYHNHFRHTWNMLYRACESNSRPAGMSMRAFLSQGLHFCHALTIHHTIEEQHIFPELAERMPAFAEHDHLISQHEMIHEGLEKFEKYLEACRMGETELRMSELKELMDTWGKVLWTHLDDEVRMLGAESMRKYWSKQEILRMNW